MNPELSVELGVKRSSCLVSYTIIIIIRRHAFLIKM